MNRIKLVKLGMTGVVVSLLLAGSASAHVTLDPKEGVIGYQRYTINVPTEKEIPTIELRVEVPENVEISGIAPIPGWTHTEKREAVDADEKDDHGHAAEGKVTEIVWTGGKINPGEYQGFGISTRYQGEPSTISWKAYQKYSDGTVVAWDGADEKLPAPSVTLAEESKVDTLVKKVDTSNTTSSNQAPLWFSFIAVLFSVAAFMVALRKNR